MKKRSRDREIESKRLRKPESEKLRDKGGEKKKARQPEKSHKKRLEEGETIDKKSCISAQRHFWRLQQKSRNNWTIIRHFLAANIIWDNLNMAMKHS